MSVYRPCIFAAISSVAVALENGVVTDKGHRASSGKCIVEFWISQPSPQATAQVCVESVASENHDVVVINSGDLVGEWKVLPDGLQSQDTTLVLADLSDDDILNIVAAHIVERCDSILSPTKVFYEQGGCSLTEVLNVGMEQKVAIGLTSAFPQLLERPNVIERIKDTARRHVEASVNHW